MVCGWPACSVLSRPSAASAAARRRSPRYPAARTSPLQRALRVFEFARDQMAVPGHPAGQIAGREPAAADLALDLLRAPEQFFVDSLASLKLSQDVIPGRRGELRRLARPLRVRQRLARCRS